MVKGVTIMPVINSYINQLKNILKGEITTEELIEKIPYLGLDLEEVNSEYFTIEYNPNRPDYSTDYGVGRSLNGILEFEIGTPKYNINIGKSEVKVNPKLNEIRPYISSVIARNIQLDEEKIRQMISMQEDLHDGIGRRRKKIAIGIHNLDVMKFPLSYTTVDKQFQFCPLDLNKSLTIQEIFDTTETGKKYRWIIDEFNEYPIILDSNNEVISFPPIINGDLTRVTSKTKNLFVDITGIDKKCVNNALAILTTFFYDCGGYIESVNIGYENGVIITPDLKEKKVEINLNLANKLLGLKLSKNDVKKCLAKCRMSVYEENEKLYALIPRYRFDIIHDVDIVEEIAIGYGIYNMTMNVPKSDQVGSLNSQNIKVGLLRDTLIGLGLIEIMNFALIDEMNLYNKVNRKQTTNIKVKNSKSNSHQVLRDMLLPSLLINVHNNKHQSYPQKIFEIGKIFTKKDVKNPTEEYHLAFAITHAKSSYAEVKSYLTSLLSNTFNISCKTQPEDFPLFIKGRSAKIIAENNIGVIGEVNPEILENFQIKMPVSAVEISLKNII